MAVYKSKNKKIGYIHSNKDIPIHNLFNRTSLFQTPHENQNLKVIEEECAVEFNNNHYNFKLYGYPLNHKTDYPMFALIIKNLINKRQTEHKTTSVRVELNDIDELFNLNYSSKRKNNYENITSSLERLSKVRVLLLKTKDYESNKYLPLIISYEFHYGKGKKQPKYVEVKISELLNSLYVKMWNISFFDFSYIDAEKIVEISTENAKALMKNFMSQAYYYIDFKLDSLITLIALEYKYEDLTLHQARYKIKEALNRLVEKNFLTLYKFNKTRAWDSVRIIPKTLCNNVDISKSVIDLLPSNFDYFQNKKVIDEEKENLKRNARLNSEVKKYPDLIKLLEEIE